MVGEAAKKAAFVRLAGEGDWHHQFKVVALLRISPFPYIVFNYASVATNVKYYPYIAGSVAGTIHDTFLAIYRYEAVTLLEKIINMVVEQPMFFFETDGARFRGMRLEDLDEQYFNFNLDDDDFSHADQRHQAEAVNITLVDNFESGIAETDVFNRFERFDIPDDETTVNITPDEQPRVPSALVPSPPRQEDPPQQEQYYASPFPVHEEPQEGETKHMIYSLPYGNKAVTFKN